MTSKKYLLVAVFLMALLVRLYYVIAVPQVSLAGSDAKEYDLIAEGLLEGKGFPVERLSDNEVEIVRPPLFPLFLAGIYSFFGHNYTVARIIQALLASLLIFIVYFIAGDIFKDEKVALVSAVMYGLYPSLIGYTGLLYSETVFIFFLVLTMFFLERGIDSAKRKYYLLAGLFLGLTTMISSRSLYLLFFILAWLLFTQKEKKKTLKNFLCMSAAMCIVVVPWSIRNYFVSGGKIIPLENYSSATALWLVTNPQGEILEWSYDKEPLKSLVGNLPINQRTLAIRKEAINNLKRYPWAYVRNCFKRFFVLFFAGHSNCFYGLEQSTFQALRDGKVFIGTCKLVLLFVNVVVIIFGFWGMWLFRKSWRSAAAVLIPIVYFVLLHTLYVAAPRLQMPIIPFLLMFASFAAVRVRDSVVKSLK